MECNVIGQKDSKACDGHGWITVIQASRKDWFSHWTTSDRIKNLVFPQTHFSTIFRSIKSAFTSISVDALHKLYLSLSFSDSSMLLFIYFFFLYIFIRVRTCGACNAQRKITHMENYKFISCVIPVIPPEINLFQRVEDYKF